MKTAFIYLFAAAMMLSACASHKKTIQGLTAVGIFLDGSSYDKAIVINEDHEKPGIDAEYAWIRGRYPGSKLNGQSLTYNNKKPFDVIHITTADGTAKDVYFDISRFYGKF